ncbi:hypothetical protein XENOCAPTIV_018873, partial [Xenoophorus captivus]
MMTHFDYLSRQAEKSTRQAKEEKQRLLLRVSWLAIPLPETGPSCLDNISPPPQSRAPFRWRGRLGKRHAMLPALDVPHSFHEGWPSLALTSPKPASCRLKASEPAYRQKLPLPPHAS